MLTDIQFSVPRKPRYMASQRANVAARLRVIAAKIEGQLPRIATLAFLIVITFEARFDAIEMEFFGIVKFRGASDLSFCGFSAS